MIDDARRARRRAVVLVAMSAIALTLFTRTAGAESVRWVQILLLFAAGACAGTALALFRSR